MKKLKILLLLSVCALPSTAQVIPLDTAHWDFDARGYVIETFKGQPSVYIQGGGMTLRDVDFLDGTIEFDIYLKKEQSFPGVYFRADEAAANAEEFYVRPHQSGNPDANQAAPMIQGITAWQLYYGERYSFPYEYTFDDWTHIRIVVSGDKAQVYMDHAENPNLSWQLFHTPKAGAIAFRGGNQSGMHLANIRITTETPEITNFTPLPRAPVENAIATWEISDKFEESRLDDVNGLDRLIGERSWQGQTALQEGVAADISRIQRLNDGNPGNTVFARVTINAEDDLLRLFEFGYSDRVVVILNGEPLYRGSNQFRSRDYRYLGTIGLFDAVYLPLKKGENTLLMAVSENFGGWLVTGRLSDQTSIEIR